MNYYINENVHTIFIMLGFSCNFKCKYCMQHEFKTITSVTYNKDILKFIEKYADIRKSKDEDLSIVFFGGEPLLFLDEIKSIVYGLKHISNITYSMITNGSLIDDSNISFLNDNNIFLTISWDGRTSKDSRNIDIFETNKENIFKLKRFAVSGVLNAYNSPKTLLDDISLLDEEYRVRYNTDEHIGFIVDNLYKLENNCEEVFDIDFERYRTEIEELTSKFIYHPEKCSYAEFVYMSNIVNTIKQYNDDIETKQFSQCMNGINVLNLDLEGNLYLCHNNNNKRLGDIYSSCENYINSYIELNEVPNFFKEYCVDCSVRFCCDGGCMLVSADEKLNFLCKQKHMIYEPVIDGLINFKQEMDKV